MRQRWFTKERHSSPAAVVAMAALVLLALYAVTIAAPTMSNDCTDVTGQVECAIDGPDWVRPVPGALILLSLCTSVAGLLVGRPFRTPALVIAYAFVLTALVVGVLIQAP